MTKGQFAGLLSRTSMHKCRVYTNRQVVGVNEGLIALALLKGQKEMSLGMSRENHRDPG